MREATSAEAQSRPITARWRTPAGTSVRRPISKVEGYRKSPVHFAKTLGKTYIFAMQHLARTASTAFLIAAGVAACGEVTHDVGTLARSRPPTDDTGVSRTEPSPEVGAAATEPSPDADIGATGEQDAAVPNATVDAARGAARTESGGQGGQEENPLDAGCQERLVPAERRRLDIYIMMDGSLTVEIPMVRRSAMAGVIAFLKDPDSNGTAVGIRYYGLGCEAAEYAVPNVQVAELPGNTAALENFQPSDLSPLPVVPALRGAIQHARERQNRIGLENTKQVVFLLTSELFLDGCGFSPEDLDNAAQEGFLGSPPIETYVFGVGALNVLDPSVRISFLEQLDRIALQGGTDQPYLVDLGLSEEEMATRLAEARDAARPSRCDFAYPDWRVGDLPGDPELVTLTYTRPVGDRVRVPRTSDASECDPLSIGWYYDDPVEPSRAIACGRTCEIIESNPSPEVDFLLGCAPPTP